jgi:hypothetical protein
MTVEQIVGRHYGDHQKQLFLTRGTHSYRVLGRLTHYGGRQERDQFGGDGDALFGMEP